jgi:hypothetical protein
MAHTYLGALLEMAKREVLSRFHRDLVLELETGPATSDQLTRITHELEQEFPGLMDVAAGGDAENSWTVAVRIRPKGPVEPLRQELGRWASRNEPFIRRYAVRQRSLWRTA